MSNFERNITISFQLLNEQLIWQGAAFEAGAPLKVGFGEQDDADVEYKNKYEFECKYKHKYKYNKRG